MEQMGDRWVWLGGGGDGTDGGQVGLVGGGGTYRVFAV